jgi:hypothetical protein
MMAAAAITLVLGTIGLYGVMAYMVDSEHASSASVSPRRPRHLAHGRARTPS